MWCLTARLGVGRSGTDATTHKQPPAVALPQSDERTSHAKKLRWVHQSLQSNFTTS